jgi:leucyl aminopeptidase (aminopeptidase T)
LTCPVEDTINGIIVADAGVFFSRVEAPIRLEVRNGYLVDVQCNKEGDAIFRQYVKWMCDAFSAGPNNWQLAEVGIGGNPNAQFSDIVMELESVQHTCHFCFGDNTVFEGGGGTNHTAWHGGTVIINSPNYHCPTAF